MYETCVAQHQACDECSESGGCSFSRLSSECPDPLCCGHLGSANSARPGERATRCFPTATSLPSLQPGAALSSEPRPPAPTWSYGGAAARWLVLHGHQVLCSLCSVPPRALPSTHLSQAAACWSPLTIWRARHGSSRGWQGGLGPALPPLKGPHFGEGRATGPLSSSAWCHLIQ